MSTPLFVSKVTSKLNTVGGVFHGPRSAAWARSESFGTNPVWKWSEAKTQQGKNKTAYTRVRDCVPTLRFYTAKYKKYKWCIYNLKWDDRNYLYIYPLLMNMALIRIQSTQSWKYLISCCHAICKNWAPMAGSSTSDNPDKCFYKRSCVFALHIPMIPLPCKRQPQSEQHHYCL